MADPAALARAHERAYAAALAACAAAGDAPREYVASVRHAPEGGGEPARGLAEWVPVAELALVEVRR